MAELDAEHLPPGMHATLQLALQSPNLAPHALERYSRAASALCGWARAVDWCACCAAALAPTRAALPDTYADQAAGEALGAVLARELAEERERLQSLRRAQQATSQRRQAMQLEHEARSLTPTLTLTLTLNLTLTLTLTQTLTLTLTRP